MSYLAIVRHGQSVFNLENRFTGWMDIELSDHGREEAKLAGSKLLHYSFANAFVSTLKRAIETFEIIQSVMQQKDMRVLYADALKERNYGKLQGMNKAEVAEKYGANQVALWRRSFIEIPPDGESLQQCQKRVLNYFDEEILTLLQQNKNVLIVAHGNSLRALMMKLENLIEEAIAETELLTGTPRLYTLNQEATVETVENLQ